MSSALTQFIDDYMLVIENDQDAWEWHKSVASNNNNDVFAIADVLRDEHESQISQTLDQIDPSHDKWQVNIMREMLLGWGVTPYEHLAREILARLDEGK